MTTSTRMIAALALLVVVPAPNGAGGGADLRPATIQAFDNYVHEAEERVAQHVDGRVPFLWVDASPARLARVRNGEVVTARAADGGPRAVSGGLIHDWVGAVFIRGVGVRETIALLQDYDGHKRVYPEVVDSKLISRDGDHFVLSLRLRKKKVITVVLNTTHDARYFRLDDTRGYSWSHSTRIAQVENAGERDERELPPGSDSGFMWRLNSYWRFAARDGGVYLECRAISLSRQIPWGLGWLVGPIVNDLPRESLENTLLATRAALTGATKGRTIP